MSGGAALHRQGPNAALMSAQSPNQGSTRRAPDRAPGPAAPERPRHRSRPETRHGTLSRGLKLPSRGKSACRKRGRSGRGRQACSLILLFLGRRFGLFESGTEGSNPLSSSAESAAKPDFRAHPDSARPDSNRAHWDNSCDHVFQFIYRSRHPTDHQARPLLKPCRVTVSRRISPSTSGRKASSQIPRVETIGGF